ncbi:hypothetical protein RCG17_22970 [Neobacillus sp. PS3-12]|uniref:hypothetical protein n=1 Tax=Neobacillus sp. PS3-12 TaxID=3070677 RepID=UPI0027E118B9|nr:hypothetical protein [Neobacillus sp. PS3-12]WML52221.1 hypothetical protein RCG17_22970 [Neobacillus sp. PS3-12]
MTVKNELVVWNPKSEIPLKLLELEKYEWNETGFSITLCADERLIRFSFNFVMSFQSTNEQMMLRFRDSYGELRDKKFSNYVWSLFKVKNSDYIKWFNEQHLNRYETIASNVEHYLFVTEDEILEVINDHPPTIHIEKKR